MEARKFEELVKDKTFMDAIEKMAAKKLAYNDWNPKPKFGATGEEILAHNIKYLEYLEIYKHNYLGLVSELALQLALMPKNPLLYYNKILKIGSKVASGFKYTMKIAKVSPKADLKESFADYAEGIKICRKDHKQAIKACKEILRMAKKQAI